MAQPDKEPLKLKRSLGLAMLTLYGVGTMVGGGFYALTGKVAAEAGMLTPWAFLGAGLIATVNAFSYAELSARYPFSAGEARYVDEAFGLRWLAAATGWMVIATGVVSAATLANAFAGFVLHFVTVPAWVIVSLMVVSMGIVTAWGITESAVAVLIVTFAEIGGLVFILVAGAGSLANVADRWSDIVPTGSLRQWSGILMGAYLAFYSFIGFEDMVNVAEEVKRPQRNLPIAIMLSMAVTGLLYLLVSLVTVLSVPMERLVESTSPLSLALEGWGAAGTVVTVIGMLSGLNGALVQVLMSSRVAYGLAQKGEAPRWLGIVHPRTRTPLQATLTVTLIVLTLALWFPVEALAKATSTILLVVFALVNLSLWAIKRRGVRAPTNAPDYPRVLPIAGFFACAAFLIFHAVMVLR